MVYASHIADPITMAHSHGGPDTNGGTHIPMVDPTTTSIVEPTPI